MMRVRKFKLKLLAVGILSFITFLSVGQLLQSKLSLTIEDDHRPSPWWISWKSQEEKCPAKRAGLSLSQSSSVLVTADLYEHLDFSVSEGSRNFWNRSFEERYLQIRKTWSDLPLEVIVVPYSHIDPGWLRTYDEYFNVQVVKILDNMLHFLGKTKDFTFIWSEISYFSRWFNQLDAISKDAVIDLLHQGRLEIVAGGWVMPDEATSHYWSVIDQFIEGHQWLKSVTGTVPKHGWSVDVFGHSSSLQLILAAAGLKSSVILRIHYAMKSFLASRRSLDFYWKQHDSRVLCHMAPSDLYSFKHTCGPDPRICLQYDFRKIQGEYSESVATNIDAENIRPKAERLLEQYGRYASLYPHNVLLVPLGDDFRYDKSIEFEQQYENYKQLFKYINENPMNAHVRFGTVNDYFKEVHRRLKSPKNITLPILRGDFVPYADIYAEGIPSYWTGLYTTRPFEKALARELEHWLRTAEILYSFARSFEERHDKKRLNSDYFYLMSARQSLDLFQHHDAITGTSKLLVVQDYRNRLHKALKDSMATVAQASQYITMPQRNPNVPFTSRMYLDLVRASPESNTERIVTPIPSGGRDVLLFNSLTFHRRDIVRVKTKSPYVKVIDKDGKAVQSQVNPVWNIAGVMVTNVYEILFVCDIEPLSFTVYKLILLEKEDWDSSSKAEISLTIADQNTLNIRPSVFSFKQEVSNDIIVDTPSITATFTESGLLKDLYVRENKLQQKINVGLFAYRATPHRSGAYLLHINSGNAIPFRNLTDIGPLVRIVRGKLVTEVTFVLEPFLSLSTKILSYEGAPNHLEMQAVFDLSKVDSGMELFMRLQSDVDNDNIFYTDSNGLQMLRRKHLPKLPIQGSVYPVTSSAFLEDNVNRLNLLTSHSHGLASPNSGCLEVMLDGRTQHDDFRGMGEGVMDNRKTTANFRLLLESSPGDSTPDFPLLTPTAYQSSLNMLYPIVSLISDKADPPLKTRDIYPSLTVPLWPIDSHLVNLRTLSSKSNYPNPSNESLLVILRQKLACQNVKVKNLDVRRLFSNIQSYKSTSLTGIHDKVTTGNNQTLETYIISFKNS